MIFISRFADEKAEVWRSELICTRSRSQLVVERGLGAGSPACRVHTVPLSPAKENLALGPWASHRTHMGTMTPTAFLA